MTPHTTVSDTPLTDAKERESEKCDSKLHAHYGWKFARTLERSLIEHKALLEQARANERRLREALTRIRDARRNPEVLLTDMSRAGMREIAHAALAGEGGET